MALTEQDNYGTITFMIQQGFERNSRDHCLCSNPKTGVDSARYVDDILSACTGEHALKKFLRIFG